MGIKSGDILKTGFGNRVMVLGVMEHGLEVSHIEDFNSFGGFFTFEEIKKKGGR